MNVLTFCSLVRQLHNTPMMSKEKTAFNNGVVKC